MNHILMKTQEEYKKKTKEIQERTWKRKNLAQKQTFKIHTKAGDGFSIAVRENNVLLVHSDDHHETQHWYKDERFVPKANDQEEQHCFALVNKATGQVMKHSGRGEPVTLIPYDPDDGLELSALWTESDDVGDGYTIVRLVNDLELCMDVVRYPDGVKDGTHIIPYECWNGENQQWKITPHSNNCEDVGDEEQRMREDYKELLTLELKELYHWADYYKTQAHIFEMTAREKANLMYLNEQALTEAAKRRFSELEETFAKQVSPNSVTTTDNFKTEKLRNVEMKYLELEGQLKEQSILFERQFEELKKYGQTRQEEQDTRLRDAILSLHNDLDERLKEQANSYERQLEELKNSAQTRQEEQDARLRDAIVSLHKDLEAQSFGFGLKKKTISVLDEYFCCGEFLGKAEQCIKDLQSPCNHGEIVKEAISLALNKNPPCVVRVSSLLHYLLYKKVFTPNDIETGCLLYGSLIHDIAMDVPLAPNNFGRIMGDLVIAGGMSFSVMKEVLRKVDSECNQILILNRVIEVVSLSSYGQRLLVAQAADVQACHDLFS